MKEILNRLITYKTLNENESKEILIRISNGELNNSQISSFLTVFVSAPSGAIPASICD